MTFEERADGDPPGDRDWSCVARGNSVGRAVFVRRGGREAEALDMKPVKDYVSYVVYSG